MHRLRSGNPQKGPIFANALGNPLSLGSVVNRVILPALNRCEACGKAESVHPKAGHPYRRDATSPNGMAGTQHGEDWEATCIVWVYRTW